MTSYIPGPNGSQSTLIPLKDILYFKTCRLSCLSREIYNLYIFVGHRGEERFHLFVYDDPLRMQAAHEQLQTRIAAGFTEEDQIEVSPALAPEADMV